MAISLQNFRSISARDGSLFVNNKGQLGLRGNSFASKIVTWIKGLYNPRKVQQENKAAVQYFFEAIRTQYQSKSTDVDFITQAFQLSKHSTSLSSRTARQIITDLDSLKSRQASAELFARLYSDYDLNNKSYGMGQIVQTIMTDNPALNRQLSANELETMSQYVYQAITEATTQESFSAEDAKQIAQTTVKSFLIENNRPTEAKWANTENKQPQPSTVLADSPVRTAPLASSTQNADAPQTSQITASLSERVDARPPPQPTSSSSESVNVSQTSQTSTNDLDEKKEALLKMVGANLPSDLKEKILDGTITSKANLIKASNEHIAQWASKGRIHRWYVDAYRKETGATPREIPDSLINTIVQQIKSHSSIVRFSLAEAYSKKFIDHFIKSNL